MGKLERTFETRRIELSLEQMRDSGDIESLYQMALQLNRWAWAMREQTDFAMAQALNVKM